jgi:hypothetical protein
MNPPITEPDGKSNSISPRLIGLIIAIALGDFLFVRTREAWTNYWLLQDGQQGMAVVTHELWSGHNAVGYRYMVNQQEYVGKSGRNWQEANYSNVQVGGKSVVYFSISHPWLSLLYKPRTVIEGLPVVIIAFLIELFAITTVLNPKKGKWAFDLTDKK